MIIPVVNSRDLPNTWRIRNDNLGNFRNRGLPFKFPYLGSFSHGVAKWFIKVYSNPGDTIVDIFGGRGTTAIQSLWHNRNVIMNDLSPYSITLCHSIMYPPYEIDILKFLNVLEREINSDKCQVSTNYAGKCSENDVAKLYNNKTFAQIIKLRNVLNDRNVLLGYRDDLFGDIDQDYSNSLKDVCKYRHEVVMFTRMVMSQLMQHNNLNISFNGINIRGTDNTNVQALIRYHDSINEYPKNINIFRSMKYYVEKIGLDDLSIRDKFYKLNRKLISCDTRKLDLPDKCADMILTSPPYWAVLNYGRATWLRLWSISGIGDPLVGKHINIENLENQNNSEIYGKVYDKITDKAGGTVNDPVAYSYFTGWYLKELYRVLKDDAVAVIIVGDYGKLNTWKLVIDRAERFGFKPKLIIMEELNKQTKSSSQLQARYKGGKNDFDVCVVLYKGNYERKNDPEQIDFRWGSSLVDDKQLSIDFAWDE